MKTTFFFCGFICSVQIFWKQETNWKLGGSFVITSEKKQKMKLEVNGPSSMFLLDISPFLFTVLIGY